MGIFTPYTPLTFLIDFLLNCAAILFATTFYSSHPLLLNVSLLVPAIFLLLSSGPKQKQKVTGRGAQVANGSSVDTILSEDALPQKPFITSYRGTMLVITCLAILAVDFKVFPRRFAKVENWGTSLMDMGVGSFVFSAGVVAARSALKQQASRSSVGLPSRLYTAMRHSLPLLILGFIRLYTVKGLDYAEHVTEYGVHWNFFFTLAFIPPFMALVDSLSSGVPSYALLAVILAIVYEAVLDFTNLKGYILTAHRTDWLSKNREGVFSLLGYLSIFLAGQATGMAALPRAIQTKTILRNSTLTKLIAGAATWIVLFELSTSYGYGLGIPVSRRLANLPYVLWVAAFNSCQLTLFCMIETFIFPETTIPAPRAEEEKRYKRSSSTLLRAFNKNGLFIFLLANVLTGLVNLILPTLTMSHVQAMGVLVIYAAVLSGVAIALDRFNITIKL